jgi:transcriptional regulator with XRE-family HTH domain
VTVDELAEELFGDEERDASELSGADLVIPNPATAYFSKKFQELAAAANVRLLDTGEGPVTVVTLHRMLIEQSPELAVSQRQVYRYYNGNATPRLDVVFELARLFDVSPRDFLPESTTGNDTAQ